jgi:hypothetical protein
VDSLLAIAAVLLGAFWIGLAIDFLPVQVGGTEMPRSARCVLLGLVLLTVVILLGTLLISRLRRPLPDDSLALVVERHHPQLAGRLVTAVQLSQPGRTGDSHDPALLSKVHEQASAVVDQVDPNRVFRWQPLVRKGVIVCPLIILTVGMAVASPEAFARAAKRLSLWSDEPWPRRAHLEMVGIELPRVTASEDEAVQPERLFFEQQTIRLPRGSNPQLRIRAEADESTVPTVCTMYYTTEDGLRGQSNLRRVGRVQDGYQAFVLDGPPLTGLSHSLQFTIRGLDDRLSDYSIEAVTPPALVGMEVRVRYPDYLREPGAGAFDFETEYQSGLRLREGSSITLEARSTLPLGNILASLTTDVGQQTLDAFQYSEDATKVSIQLNDLRNATTARFVPVSQDQISAQAPFRYFLGVILDEPPDVELKLKGIGTAVTPIAVLPMSIAATDDYAIRTSTISLAPSGEEGHAPLTTLSPQLDRQGQGKVQLDLRELAATATLPELKPGEAITVFAEAQDGYDLGAPHIARSELFRLQIVAPEQLLALLERRELAMRGRLEQTIDETRSLKESLELFGRAGFETSEPETGNPEDKLRVEQIRRLRVQQSGLQVNKTAEELSGIAASLDDLLEEMINNRVDSVDRRERIGTGVRDPLRAIVAGPLQQLRGQIGQIDEVITRPKEARTRTATAIKTADEVLLGLTAILEKMLDLESFNEILDMVREMIEDQNQLLDDTKTQQKKRVLDLFK